MKKQMTAVQVLQQAFRQTGWEDVTSWMKESGADKAISLQSATAILNRDKMMGFMMMVPMAYYMRLPLEQIISIAKECGDTCIHKLFQKSVNSPADDKLLQDFHLLSSKQRQLICDLIAEMKPTEVEP